MILHLLPFDYSVCHCAFVLQVVRTGLTCLTVLEYNISCEEDDSTGLAVLSLAVHVFERVEYARVPVDFINSVVSACARIIRAAMDTITGCRRDSSRMFGVRTLVAHAAFMCIHICT